MTTFFAFDPSGLLNAAPGASRKWLPGGAVNPAGLAAAGGFTVTSVSSVTASRLAPEPLLAAEQDTQLGVDGGLDVFVEPVAGAGRGRDGYRGAAAGGHRPEYLQDVTVEQVLRAEEHGDRPAVVEADLGRRGLRPAGRPPGPATLAVVPLDQPVLVLALHAVMAAGRDQQRRAAGLEAHLGGEGQAGPVGPVEQPDHFWQAGHGGTIRGKSAGGGGNATPFGQIMPCAGLGPARLG